MIWSIFSLIFRNQHYKIEGLEQKIELNRTGNLDIQTKFRIINNIGKKSEPAGKPLKFPPTSRMAASEVFTHISQFN